LLQLGQPLPLDPLLDGEPLLAQLALPASSLALVQNPAALLAADSPWRSLATSLLALALPPTAGPLPALVAGADGGPLLGARSDQGWLLGSRQDQPDPALLAAPLAEAGYAPAPLLLKQRPLLVWSQLLSKPVKGNPDQLQARLAGARAQGPMTGPNTSPGTSPGTGPGSGLGTGLHSGSDLAWWAEGLAVLETQLEGRHPPKERLQQLALLQSPQAPLQWAMDGATARSLLAAWQPWRLLVALSGADGSLAESVRGAALSLEADPGGDGAGPDPGAADLGGPASASRDTLLRLRGQLQFQD
jgi:hypothetical protein